MTTERAYRIFVVNSVVGGMGVSKSTPGNSGNLQASPLPTIGPLPSVPPKWQELVDATALSLDPYQLCQVEADSLEFQELTEFMGSIQITSAEKIVNPGLWQQFSTKWKEMIRSKADDLELLGKLGLEEKELLHRANASINFNRSTQLQAESAAYSPNQVLLCHCTRSPANLDQILLQGLDERMGHGGLLGRGIYFADDPMKSIGYDGTGYVIICSVLLGDCLSVTNSSIRSSLVREPDKVAGQKRNSNDLSFDSIAAGFGYNEYVIFNRSQCYPVYRIKYNRAVYNIPLARGKAKGKKNARTTPTTNYETARRAAPAIAWTNDSTVNYAMPNPVLDGTWPFFAQLIFQDMGVTIDPQLEAPNSSSSSSSLTSSTSLVDIDRQLAALAILGFLDETKNREILQGCNNNFDQAVNFLLDSDADSQAQPQASIPDASSETASPKGSPLDISIRQKLLELGFTDEAKNRDALQKSNNNLDEAVSLLLESANNSDMPHSSSPTTSPPTATDPQANSTLNSSVDTKNLATLASLGFPDEAKNKQILEQYNNNLDLAMNALLDGSQSLMPSTSEAASVSTPSSKRDNSATEVEDGVPYKKSKLHEEGLNNPTVQSLTDVQPLQGGATPQVPAKEECFICSDNFDAFSHSPSLWQELRCGHRLCTSCYQHIETSGTTMSGISHTFIKCPFCQRTTGTEIGDCPDGTMSVTIVATPCAGYPDHNSIQITYLVNSLQHHVNWTAFLPNTPGGNQVLELLRTAWDRRITFTIGTSNTTGAQNVLVWNIHHKTSPTGGVESHGFPDPHYLDRVKWELKSYGIE